jgi:hypothetical protein
MKHIYNLLVLLLFLSCTANDDFVIISGQATDFEGNIIDSCIVQIKNSDFTTAYETYTNTAGNYSLKVKKGKYMALYAIRPKEYPRENAVAEKDMRLEFWAWNIVADKDLTINPRYHKLELYGAAVFKTFGGYNGFLIYFRPMSLTKYLSYSPNIYLDKKNAEQNADISVKLENLKVKIFIDNEPLKINLIQPITEFEGEGQMPMTAFLVQTDAPKTKPDKSYVIFRIEAENTEFNEKGENLYFYELKNYE